MDLRNDTVVSYLGFLYCLLPPRFGNKEADYLEKANGTDGEGWGGKPPIKACSSKGPGKGQVRNTQNVMSTPTTFQCNDKVKTVAQDTHTSRGCVGNLDFHLHQAVTGHTIPMLG